MNYSKCPELDWASCVHSIRRVSRPKLTGFGTHVGVLVESAFGSAVYDRNTEGINRFGVTEFAEGHTLTLGPPVTDRRAIDASLERLRTLVERPGEHAYHLMAKNCEHFTNYVLTGVHRSEQASGVVVLAGLAGVALAVALAPRSEED